MVAAVSLLVLAVDAAGKVWAHPAAAGLVMGGGVANLLDRAGDGTVTDFLSVGWWPTFDLADSSIVLGAALLVLAGLRSAPRPVPTDVPQEHADRTR